MLKKSFLLMALGVSFIAAAATPPHKNTQAPVVKPIVQHRQLTAFTQVNVNGHINVSLHTGYSRPEVILQGDPRDLAYVSVAVTNSALHINLGNGYPRFGAVSADIRGRYLNSFEYHGSGVITGNNLRSGLLNLTLENEGRTTLKGQMALRNLEISGGGYVEISGISGQNLNMKLSGKPKVQLAGVVNLACLDIDNGVWLSMYWVKSRILKVRGHGASFIQLGGVADRLDVELWDTSHFNGRYLRAQNVFAKTHGKSVAEISAINKQHTLASDASDIRFYNIPDMKTDFMAFNGSVLDLRDWNAPDLEEYDRYNK